MDNEVISEIEKDAIGEIMNISMGSAATAASELLNAKVWITTPRVSVLPSKEMNHKKLEPAVCVKIEYIKGLSGANLMVLRQDDVQLILNQLMGQPLVVTPDFEFDELNISAVSEVMNQMMGASATALSDFLGVSVDISTPTPYIMDEVDFTDIQSFEPDELVVMINFDLTIDGVIKSQFSSVMSVELAKFIASSMMNQGSMGAAPEPEPTPPPAPEPAPAGGSDGKMSQEQMDAMFAAMAGGGAATSPAPAQPTPPVQPIPQAAPPVQPAPPQMQQPMPQYAAPPMPDPQAAYGYPQQMPYGYPPPQQPYGYGYPLQQPYGYQQQPISIQNAQLQHFDSPDINLSGEQKDNLQLLMGVPLQISVEIGTAKRTVKDILEFTQGTIIELERQAGAPVDVVVNGNLIARGDVVVIDDNFAVRITEIIKSKFIDSLNKE